MLTVVVLCLSLFVCSSNGQTDEEIRSISEQIWAADSNRLEGSDVVYHEHGPRLFSHVNEARLTGTYALMLDLFNNYSPDATIEETCGFTCYNEEEAFLDGIMATQPIQLLHNWLINHGLASSSTVDFKSELRQYWFLKYTRAGGPLGSDGFEHVFLGEIDDGVVKGSHNWVNFYFEEQQGDFVYGTYQATCPVEGVRFSFDWLDHHKSITSAMIRSSPEAEIALYTLCLLARTGSNCPVRLDGVETLMTTWDMNGYPKTIGSAYLNC